MSRKTVLVTGASRGIGKAIAIKFARKGYNVAISCIRNEERLMQTKKEIENYQVPCLAYMGDMGNMDCCKEFFAKVKKQFGGVDVLVNNAGVSYIGLLQDMSSEDWNKMLHMNLTSVFNCCKLAIPYMVHQKQGKIINISSVWGIAGASCEAAYSATKGGINALTRALAKELGPSNIQVNAIACGAIDTEMNQWMEEDELIALVDEIPAGRLGKPKKWLIWLIIWAIKSLILPGRSLAWTVAGFKQSILYISAPYLLKNHLVRLELSILLNGFSIAVPLLLYYAENVSSCWE